MRLSRLFLILPLVLCGCISSKEELLGPDSRVLPFLPGTKFEIYRREQAREPWVKDSDTAAVTADASLVVRELDNKGKLKDYPRYTFHSLGFERFLAQGQYDPKGPYSYSLLEVRNGEGILVPFDCKKIDQQAFKAAGGTVDKDNVCFIDGLADKLGFLKTLAANPVGDQYRYVPVRNK